MLSSYRALLARGGAAQLAFACALGWLSYTGYSLAIILAVHAATGSFAVAGRSRRRVFGGLGTGCARSGPTH